MKARVASVVLGVGILTLGVAGFFSMNASVLAGTIQNGPAMSSGLGVQLFVGLLLLTYGLVMTRTRLSQS